MAETKNPITKSSTQSTLAIVVLSASFLVIMVLGWYALSAASGIVDTEGGGKAKMAAVQNVLSIFLPMFGTWVGTIIAFYFSKENFEAASKSTQQLTKEITETLTPKQRLEATPVKDAMLAIESVSTLVRTGNDADIKIKKDILEGVLIKSKRNRLPILDEKGHIIYMLHRSILEQFIVRKLSEETQTADSQFLESLTLHDFVNDEALKHYANASFLTVTDKASLAEIKTLMDHIEHCADVFVTEDGTKNTRVIGWVTNNIILAKANI